jgi:hypothetical protein
VKGFTAFCEALNSVLADRDRLKREEEVLADFRSFKVEEDRWMSTDPRREAAELAAKIHGTTTEDVLRIAERNGC